MKILNFGSANIDYVYTLDRIVSPGETLSSQTLNIFPGGKGLNQSIALSRAGAKVWFAGAVGQDGALLTQTFTENGVDITYLDQTSGKSGHAIIQVSQSGENAIFVYPGANACITKEKIDAVLSDFAKDDILLLQNEISNLSYLIEKAYERGMCIVLNPSPIQDALFLLDFHKLSYLILNEIEAASIAGSESVEACLEYFKTQYPNLKIMLTLGEKGCIYADSTQRFYQPIFETPVVDTTAAGDTFTGYFITGLYKNMPIPEILKLAACASAIAVSRHGAAPSIPYLPEVMQGLNLMKSKPVNNKAELIRDALMDYLRQNMAVASLEAFAAQMQYSTVYASHLIKKVTGMNFKAVLQKVRIQHAAWQLLHTELSIDEIIKSTGYENNSYFRQLFKKTYGLNPLQYRNKGGYQNDQ